MAGPAVKKTCLGPCGKSLPILDFPISAPHGDRRHPYCKKCRATWGRAHYRENATVLRMVNALRRQEHPEAATWASYKSNAKRKHLVFTLTFEQFMSFWQKSCFYCGDGIKRIGLDRVDNTKGYTLENIVPCCTPCNHMKKAQTQEEFISRCYRIGRRALREAA